MEFRSKIIAMYAYKYNGNEITKEVIRKAQDAGLDVVIREDEYACSPFENTIIFVGIKIGEISACKPVQPYVDLQDKSFNALRKAFEGTNLPAAEFKMYMISIPTWGK